MRGGEDPEIQPGPVSSAGRDSCRGPRGPGIGTPARRPGRRRSVRTRIATRGAGPRTHDVRVGRRANRQAGRAWRTRPAPPPARTRTACVPRRRGPAPRSGPDPRRKRGRTPRPGSVCRHSWGGNRRGVRLDPRRKSLARPTARRKARARPRGVERAGRAGRAPRATRPGPFACLIPPRPVSTAPRRGGGNCHACPSHQIIQARPSAHRPGRAARLLDTGRARRAGHPEAHARPRRVVASAMPMRKRRSISGDPSREWLRSPARRGGGRPLPPGRSRGRAPRIAGPVPAVPRAWPRRLPGADAGPGPGRPRRLGRRRADGVPVRRREDRARRMGRGPTRRGPRPAPAKPGLSSEV